MKICIQFILLYRYVIILIFCAIIISSLLKPLLKLLLKHVHTQSYTFKHAHTRLHTLTHAQKRSHSLIHDYIRSHLASLVRALVLQKARKYVIVVAACLTSGVHDAHNE